MFFDMQIPSLATFCVLHSPRVIETKMALYVCLLQIRLHQNCRCKKLFLNACGTFLMYYFVTVNGAEVGRLPQSESSNNALLASVKAKNKKAEEV